jgi:hypothetical protein
MWSFVSSLMMIAHDEQKKMIMPVAEFMTTCHAQDNISYYLTCILNIYKTPAKIIVTDFSWPLINSSLKAFNNMNIMNYLSYSYDIIINKNNLLEIPSIVMLCSTHFLKNIAVKSSQIVKNLIQTRQKSKDKDEQRLRKQFEIRVNKARKKFMFSFSLLMNSISIEEFVEHLTKIWTVFKTEKKNETVDFALNDLELNIRNRYSLYYLFSNIKYSLLLISVFLKGI